MFLVCLFKKQSPKSKFHMQIDFKIFKILKDRPTYLCCAEILCGIHGRANPVFVVKDKHVLMINMVYLYAISI